MIERAKDLKITPVSPFRSFHSHDLGDWNALDTQYIKYTYDTVHPWVNEVVKNTLVGSREPLPPNLEDFCPLDDQKLIALTDKIYTNSDDRTVMVAELRQFRHDVQCIVNHMSAKVPTLAIDGPHGTGKTTLIMNLAKRLMAKGIAVGITKYNGFVSVNGETDETRLYTGLQDDLPMREKLISADQERQNSMYKWDTGMPSPGEQSWEYLKAHLLKVMAGLYNSPKKIVISDRSPISRTQGWMKDRNAKPEHPFSTLLDMSILTDYYKDSDPYNYFGWIRMEKILLPLPYTLYLDEDINSVQARLSTLGEEARVHQNERNHRSLRGIALEYRQIFSNYDGCNDLVRFTAAEPLEDKVQAAYEYAQQIVELK